MDVPGLKYVAAFEPGEAALIAAVDAEPWLADLPRRVQHYGYRYRGPRRGCRFARPQPGRAPHPT